MMPKSPPVREEQTASQNETRDVDYGVLLEELASRLPYQYAAILTTLPRGSMQIVQPRGLNEAVTKGYREYHRQDRIGWEAMIRHQCVRAMDCWPQGQFESSAYMNGFLRPMRLQFVLAAPLTAPVLDGYPGVIELFRTPEQGAFDAKTISALIAFAKQLDELAIRTRDERRGRGGQGHPLEHRTKTRMFVFDSNLHVRMGEPEFAALDSALRQNILDLARQRFGQVNGKQTSTDRVSLPESRGDLWNFRVVVHNSYPALGDGPFVFFCIQPDCADWGTLRPADFAADDEIARLVPALSFMQQQFSAGPTLHEIARTVHLSPFHFHRRFTELLGITPKHFLLDCQIEKAKSQLAARQKELAEIARECGFAHQSHFTSRFKQATGLTPTRWRRLALEDQKR